MESLETTLREERRAPVDDGPRVQATGRRVLVVEDDPTHREILIEMLTPLGYLPIPVGSAEEAEFAVRRGIDAAVVDVFLPGRSGPVLMSRLRERFPEAVLVGISALGDPAMARRCKGMGADLFISKPVRPEDLAEALTTPHHAWH